MTSQSDDVKQTADRIRANSATWSLEGDAEFLRLMTSVSNSLISRGNKTSSAMHKMMLDLSCTNIGLSNVTNKLLALQNSQFIENRVHEDDECITDNANKAMEIDRRPTESSVPEYVQDAFQSGVQMMNKFYDKVAYNFDDSDDETGGNSQKSVLYLPKNLYKQRALPYLIGSKEWQENRHIGLIDNGDEIKNEVTDDLQKSDVDDGSDSISSDKISTASSGQSLLDESDGRYRDNGSAQADSNSDTSVIKEFKPAPIRLFYEESFPNDDERSPRPIVDPNTASIFAHDNYRAPYIASNLFDNEPPEIQEQISKPKDHKPANLFADDDSDDDGSYPSAIKKPTDPLHKTIQSTVIDSVKPTSTLSYKKSADEQSNRAPVIKGNVQQSRMDNVKSTNLFAGDSSDDENSLFSSASAKPADEKKLFTNTILAKTANLFADDDIDDDENDLFAQKKSDVKEKTSIKKDIGQTNFTKITDLFAANNSDEDDKLFSSKSKSIFEPKTAVTANLFAGNSSDEDNSIFKKIEPKSNLKKDIKASVESKSKSLAANKTVIKSVPIPKTNLESVTKSKANLFGDSDDDDNQLFSAKPKTKAFADEKKSKARTSLFGDDDDDDGPLFVSAKNKQETRLVDKSIAQTTSALNPLNEVPADLSYAPPKSNEKSSILKSSNLFNDDFESDEEFFIPKRTNSNINLGKTIEIIKTDLDIDVSTTARTLEPTIAGVDVDAPVTLTADTDVTDKAQPEKMNSSDNNYDFLGNLLGEGPPDEDIFKSTKSDAKEKSSFQANSSTLNDEKASLFNDSDFLGSDICDKIPVDKDDDDALFKSVIDENKSFGNYSSLRLFNEEPPDDDTSTKFDSKPVKRSTKRNLIGVFDDTDNTGKDTVGNIESISNTYKYMLFADEPPPFDLEDKLPQDSRDTQKLPPAINLNTKKRMTVKTDTSTDSESSPNPKKVKDTISTISTTKRHIANRKSPAKELPNISSALLDVDSSAKPLDSLNKSRAKIMKPRKPSTRAGRKNQYEKYVQTTEDEELTESLPSNAKDKKSQTTVENQNVHILETKTISPTASKIDNRKIFNLTVNQKELQSKIVSELRKRTSTLFQDDDESNADYTVETKHSEEDDTLFSSRPKSIFESKSAVATNLFAGNNSTTKAEEINKKKLENKTVDLFANDVGAHGDQISNKNLNAEAETVTEHTDELISSKVDNKPTILTANAQGIKKVNSLFGDESSDEDFFEKHIAKTALSIKKSSGASKSMPTARNIKPGKSTQVLEEKKKSSKLFSSSEDDDDDLFLTKRTVKLNTKPSEKANLPQQHKESQSQTSTSATGTTQTKKTVTLSKVVENPLADLFD